MALLLVDLDNTLIDRTGAFARWARTFVASHSGSLTDEEWLIAADRDGHEDRQTLAAMIAGRFGLPDDGELTATLLATLRGGVVENIVIDDAVAVRKPDPEIFRLAAVQAGTTLEGAWMIGDTADADIAGAVNAGISSVWIRRGRDWEISDYTPTRIADTFTEAVAGLSDHDQSQRR